MAIINSVAVGKARGKLGNIVFQSYGGRTFARQKNEKISTPASDAQIGVRNQCGNCNSAFSYLSGYLVNWTNQGSKSESLWNTFYRMTLNSYAKVRPFQANRAVNQLINLDLGKPNHIHIDSIILANVVGNVSNIKINFTVLAYEFQEDLQFYCMTKMTEGNFIHIQKRIVTLAEWNQGFMIFSFAQNYNCISFCYAQHPRGFSDNLLVSDYLVMP